VEANFYFFLIYALNYIMTSTVPILNNQELQNGDMWRFSVPSSHKSINKYGWRR